jgi:regulator of nonsense transcripts 2
VCVAGLYQSRVASVKFLGELYAYKLVSSPVIFSTLWLLVSFGHDAGGGSSTASLDPPTNYFRVRLVCALLDSCGTFFAKGVARRRLDAFLPYLQMYILSKPALPLDVDLDLAELYGRLKLTPPQFASFEEARAAVAAAEARAAAEATSGLQAIDEEAEVEVEEDDDEDAGSIKSGAESDSASGSSDGEEDEEGDEEDTEEEEDSSDDGSDTGSESEEDEGDEVRRPKTAEDEAFERELAAALGETPVPGVPAPGPRRSKPSTSAALPTLSPETMAFHVMVRKGGRDDRSKDPVHIPVSAGVAQHLRDKEVREAAERAELKRLVLEADRRGEEEVGPARRRVHVFSTGAPRRY